MHRRDILLKRALAANDKDAPQLNDTATTLKELNQTSQNRQIIQGVKNTSEGTVSEITNLPSVPVLQIDLPCQDTNDNINDNITSIASSISIDPPSYSPITPQNTLNVDILSVQSDWSRHSTVTSPEPDTFIVQDYAENGSKGVEDSPVRQMSPATLGLLHTLLDGSDDDSVKDPNYVISESSDISNTDSESILLQSRITIYEQSIGKGSNSVHEDIEEEICSTVCEEEVSITNNVNCEDECTGKGSAGRPKRGRKRKFDEYTLAERKSRKYANLPYRGKQKDVSAKTFKSYECVCKKQCHLNVNEEKRRQEFNKFITLGSYEAQLLYICSNVAEKPKKRSYVSGNTTSRVKKPRNFSRTYKISDIPVCRDMFINTFQITTQKITISLKKQRNGDKLRDCRGHSSGGWNKTPQQQIDFVCDVINKLPKYESHYSRSQIGDALYLQPGLTLQKNYDLYINEFKEVYGNDNKHYVSLPIFRKIFLQKFNLRFKSLKKDTCNKCDTLAAKLKCLEDLSIRDQLLSEKDRHLKLAESLRKQMNSEIQRAKTDQTFECVTFDMEKTLPLPRIPTNVVFYKRQLWFYNCGVHVSSTNQGYCFVWVEGEAGRGAQEVGSCLIRFINKIMRPNIEELSLWSDSCGGQNRNIKLVLLLKTILDAHPTLKMIQLNFLESGHTFLPNDTDFGKIESHLKNYQRLYTAEDYVNVIKTCTKKTPLVPIKMKKQDFVGTEKLEKNITNRKTFTNKVKVNWLRTKHIQLKKDHLYTVFMKSDECHEYQELHIGRKLKGSVLPISSDLLVPLWPDGKPITQAKLNDLKSMFHLIPQDCLTFYKQLKGMEGVNDDIEGFGAEPDFDLQTENDDFE